MKAVTITTGGGPGVLQQTTLATPDIQTPTQVRVRLHAAGINPIDTKIRSAPERFPLTLPAIPGCDGAGVIEALGENAGDWQVGDEVYFSQPGFMGRQGTYAEYAVVDAALLAPKPASLDFKAAAAAPLVLITAWEALHDRARIQSGQSVLVHAGAGGVGHVAIQLAKQAGCRVIATVSNDEKAAFVKQLGADDTINYRDEDVVARVMALTEGQGVNMAFDTVGGTVLQSCFACVRPYGDVVTILQPTVDTDWSEARKRNLRFSFELMLSPVMLGLEEAKAHQGAILRQCAALFDGGKLAVTVAASYPLDRVVDAHEYLEAWHPMGKLVLEIH